MLNYSGIQIGVTYGAENDKDVNDRDRLWSLSRPGGSITLALGDVSIELIGSGIDSGLTERQRRGEVWWRPALGFNGRNLAVLYMRLLPVTTDVSWPAPWAMKPVHWIKINRTAMVRGLPPCPH